jgi:hypothetical protein
MISTGLATALIAWATGNTDRIAQLVTERDALVASFLSGGKAATTMISASANGKSFSFDPSMTREDKLALLTNVLTELGQIDGDNLPASAIYGNFSEIAR